MGSEGGRNVDREGRGAENVTLGCTILWSEEGL